jgi:hypothetical protein
MAGSNGSGDGHKFGYRPIDTSVDCAAFGLIQHVSMSLYIVTADHRRQTADIFLISRFLVPKPSLGTRNGGRRSFLKRP